MNESLATQINTVSDKIKSTLTDEKIIRNISFGSKLTANTVSLNLAINLSLSGKKILLFDLIPENISMRKTLKIVPHSFLDNHLVLLDQFDESLISSTRLENISIISTNQMDLNIDHLNAMLNHLTEKFDYIIINENYNSQIKTSLMDLRMANYRVLVVEQRKTKKRQFVKFLNRIPFHFDGFLLIQ